MKKLVSLLLSLILLLSSTAFAEGSTLAYDVIVIGAGGAGMTAAIAAKQAGALNVLILEKMGVVGGNTVRATAGMNAAETKYQAEKNIADTVDLMIEDTMKGGKELNDKALVETLAKNSASAVDWVESIGGDLSDVGIMGGASVERTHRPTGGAKVGGMLIDTLFAKVQELGIPVYMNSKATAIVVDEAGAVSAVDYEQNGQSLRAYTNSVVIATGGYGANIDMVVENVPTLAGFGTTNHKGATGDGITMAVALGAATVDMDQIQTHPTVNPTNSTMYTEAVRGNGGILVNKTGNRFTNELGTRDVVSKAILEQEDAVSYLFFDQTVRESLSAIEAYIKGGIVTEAATLEEMAEKLQMPDLVQSIAKYNGFVEAGVDADFGRENMKTALNNGPFYAGLTLPAVHHTMGGLKINTAAEVLNAEGNAIPGLYAAGEVVGGVHGANRLGGNAVADIVVFGRIAADSAVAYLNANSKMSKTPIPQAEAAVPEEVAPAAEGNFKDGEYTASTMGHEGEIDVVVVVAEGRITEIRFGERKNTPALSDGAMAGISATVIANQSLEGVDVVAGATVTSKAIIEALTQIFEQIK